MISFIQKPGLNSYFVRETRFTEFGGVVCIENTEVFGYGRFHPINIVALWDLPFLKVFKDGNMWCVLVGPNLQEGVAEFYPIPEDKCLYDQITDSAREYAIAHPGSWLNDRCEYWLPQDIELMSKQSRKAA